METPVVAKVPAVVAGQVNKETPTTYAEKDVRAKSIPTSVTAENKHADPDKNKALESPSKKSSDKSIPDSAKSSQREVSGLEGNARTNGKISSKTSDNKQPSVVSDKDVGKITKGNASDVPDESSNSPVSAKATNKTSVTVEASRGESSKSKNATKVTSGKVPEPTPLISQTTTSPPSIATGDPLVRLAPSSETPKVPSAKTTKATKVSSAKNKETPEVSSVKTKDARNEALAKNKETSKAPSVNAKDAPKVSSVKSKHVSKVPSVKSKDVSQVSSVKSKDVPNVPLGKTAEINTLPLDKTPVAPNLSSNKTQQPQKVISNGTSETQQISSSNASKKAESSVPLVNLPVVQPIERGTTLRMMRRPRGMPRSAQRALNTSNNVQNVLQQMVGGNQRTGVPCGRCDCCKSLLSYVTVLRNFMDHIVSGMAQGAIATEENPVLPPPPCTLCEIQHVPHVDHTPKPSDQTNVSTGDQQPKVGSFTERTTAQPSPNSSSQKQPQQTSYSPGQIQQFPHHGPGGWQHQGQGGTSHYQGGGNVNFQQPGGSQQQGQGGTSHFQGGGNVSFHQPGSGFTSQTQNLPNQIHGQQSGGNQGSNASFGNSGEPQVQSTNQSKSSINTWSTFTDNNAPKAPSHSSPHTTTTQQGDASSAASKSRNPRRVMEKIAWGAGTQQPSGKRVVQGSAQFAQQQPGSVMNAEAPLTESPTEIYPTGSPSKHHLEQYDETYPEEYDDEDYEDELNEAYVTLATDNQTALLCMVLGNSLLLSGTSKALVVLVTEDVSPHMRYLLSTIYNNVESVDMMESPGTTNLALLEQPDLGISFTKLLIWGIEHFDKGVFLDPNTLVVQNCDELFERDELSAVPDIGWPDCFNGDVFVYKPSMETFWSLLKCAEDQDSFDGGDQGLLNMYFRDWSRNISKKLPFIYNLMANVSYTYRPAFKQFGSQVKIVNFFGSYKPLNVQFHSATGQMAPDSNVHPTYAQFVYYWLEIFTKRVLPLFSQEVHNLVDSQDYSSAMDVLKFFPSNSRKRRESLPMPPSFRVYADANLDRTRRHSSVILGSAEKEVGLATHDKAPSTDDVSAEVEAPVTPAVPETLPGSEIGNYQDMSAWEHGRMDYLGTHGSDNIMARLDYFMRNPTQRES